MAEVCVGTTDGAALDFPSCPGVRTIRMYRNRWFLKWFIKGDQAGQIRKMWRPGDTPQDERQSKIPGQWQNTDKKDPEKGHKTADPKHGLKAVPEHGGNGG